MGKVNHKETLIVGADLIHRFAMRIRSNTHDLLEINRVALGKKVLQEMFECANSMETALQTSGLAQGNKYKIYMPQGSEKVMRLEQQYGRGNTHGTFLNLPQVFVAKDLNADPTNIVAVLRLFKLKVELLPAVWEREDGSQMELGL